jgi:hypothetical protein
MYASLPVDVTEGTFLILCSLYIVVASVGKSVIFFTELCGE